MDCENILALKGKYKNEVKVMTTESEIDIRLVLHDISISMGGHDEDVVYANHPVLMKNIRRGNTIISYFEGDQLYTNIMARKGLNKFFDIKPSFLLEQSALVGALDEEEAVFRNLILNPPKVALEKKGGNYAVELIKTVKANGENAQVSWCSFLKYWVICSKNVSLVAEKREDLNYYYQLTATRYKYSLEIAEVWFDFVERLEMNSHDDVEMFKKEMSEMTLVGELCGKH